MEQNPAETGAEPLLGLDKRGRPEVIWKKDQNGTVHEYTYDNRGRQTAVNVTAGGPGCSAPSRSRTTKN